MFYSEPTTLIVVYKDEMLVNQIKKLVETKDDEDAENTVGTKDGTVNIVSWTEKVWLEQKKAGNINNKVLFLGNIKGVDNLIPVIDVKFNEFGVKYGWAGTQAVLCVDPKAISKKEDYISFLQKLAALPVPEKFKITTEVTSAPSKKSARIVAFLGSVASEITSLAKDVFTNKKAVKQQMLFYGIMNLYANHLEEFMNS